MPDLVDPRPYWIRAMLGPAPVREKTPAELRWEDDGGPTAVACEGWEHVLSAPTEASTFGPSPWPPYA